MSNIIERLGLTNEVKEINLGKSFSNDGGSYFHTFRYDFKPASVDVKKVATVDIGERHEVKVSVPHIDKGSGTTHAVFKGSKKPYNKECVLIIDHRTGDITLEKLTYNVQLKKTRAEGTSKIKQNVLENNFSSNNSRKSSPVQKSSPKEKSNSKFSNWTSNHFTPAPKCSPLPKSPNSQSSPPNRTSPSVPSLVPPSLNFDTKHSNSSQVPSDKAPNKSMFDATDMPEIGVLTSSESSSDDSSGSSSSDSESSDNEAPVKSGAVSNLPGSSNNTNHNASSKNVMSYSQPAPAVLSMPKFSQLSEDLQLSESDSD